jgi:hypothetical protein
LHFDTACSNIFILAWPSLRYYVSKTKKEKFFL